MIVRVELRALLSPLPLVSRPFSAGSLETSLGASLVFRPITALAGIAANAFPPLAPDDPLDIRIAKDQAYIIADADGIGFDTTTRGQRDKTARLVRDKDGNIIGDSDK